MTPRAKAEEEKLSFEASLEKIRTIVTEIEGGQLSLEEAIEKYRDGSKLIDHTRSLILDAELRISELNTPTAED
jgi:exodeoxyribonuclease VII small subunit